MPLGIVVGTYSSFYVSSSLLITLGLRADPTPRKGGLQDGAEWVGPKVERKFELTHNIPSSMKLENPLDAVREGFLGPLRL